MAPSETQELVERFEEFYRDKYSDDIRDLAQEYPDGKRSLYIDWEVLHEFDSDLADDFLTTPRQLKEYAEEALRLSEITDVNLGQAHVRLHNLPEITRISDLRSKHLNSLVSVYGTVIRVSEVVSQPDEVAWECQRCGTLTRIPQRASVQSFNNARKPHECQGCERQGPFQANHSQSTFQDAQSIVVREPLEGTGTEDERASIVVNLNDDLAGSLSVGDHLVVTGVLNFTDEDSDTTASLPDKYLDGHSLTHSRANEHIDLTEEEKKEILELTQSNSLYEDLTASIAPTIEGYEQEKLALLLQLFSGVRKELPDGREIRGDIHVLLVGDPGTAKSVVAQQAARLAPRAALVDGSDASAAGLTSAAAVSSTSTGGDPWTIEGGIIAMANEGLACIDNFDQLSSDAQNALHGVLEHQEINASKATEKRSIPAETSVLATANPKYGRFDEYEPIAEQVDFIPQLISEFDLLFTISDQPDPDHDREVADRVLKTQYSGQLSAQQRELPHPPSNPDQIEEALEAISPPIDHELLQKHITYAQRNCYPKMTEEAQETIKDWSCRKAV
jgi:replicative DNA helicase Mcm